MELAHGMDGRRRSFSDYPVVSTDPFSFLSNPDFLSFTPDGFLGESTGGFTSDECAPTSWSTTGMVDTTQSMPMQLDPGGMSFNELDFNSVEFMNTLLNLDPTVTSSDDCGAVGVTSCNPEDTSSQTDMNFLLDPQLSTSPALGTWTPEGNITIPSTSDAQDAQLPSTLPEPPPALPIPAPANAPASGLLNEDTGRTDGITAATSTEADTTIQSNKDPIPRLRPPSIRSSPKSSPSSSARADASPSPPAASGQARTKLSHSAVERRYRTNMKQYLKNLREVVPALRVLELKPGNRISNLSFKPGTRRAGVDADPSAEGEDIIDERGYIDGVKVARNGSKTTVVLKSIEYIRVLKRRETRLKREQEGIKELVRSFPGGPEHLHQWELAWREKFGGPEKDELEEESAEGKRDSQCDEFVDSMDNDVNKSMSGGRRSLKRTRTGAASSDDGLKVASASGQSRDDITGPKKYVPIRPAPTSEVADVSSIIPPEFAKRRRGRPRKNPLPPLIQSGSPAQEVSVVQTEQRPATAVSQDEPTTSPALPDCQTKYGETRPGHLLLSVFAFVSFFISPLPLSPAGGSNRNTGWTYVHSGSVLARHFEFSTVSSSGIAELDWRDAILLMHLSFSAFMVFSVLRPQLLRLAHASPQLLSSGLHRINTLTYSFVDLVAFVLHPFQSRRDPGEKFRAGARKLKQLAIGRLVMPEIETQVFREAFGIKPGVINLLIMPVRLLLSEEWHDHWRLERRVFMRLVELVALDANSSLSLRLLVFLSVFRFRHGCSSTATEIASLALVIFPVWRAKSVRLWELALARVHGRGSSSYIYKPYETFALESMSVDEAAQGIARLHKNAGARVMTLAPDNGQCRGEYSGHRDLASPLAALARQAVHEYIRANAEILFVQATSSEQEECPSLRESHPIEYERLLSAGRSLDPPTVALLDYFDQVYNSKATDHGIIVDPSIAEENVREWGDFSAIHMELKALVDAIVLYRNISIPTGTCGDDRSSDGECAIPQARDSQFLELKRCLASSAFNRTDEVRNARARVLENLTVN